MPDASFGAPKSLRVTSNAFKDGAMIPPKHTCTAKDVSPPLAIEAVPATAKALAFIMDDPDAPRGTWTHWTWWNLPTAKHNLPEGADIRSLGGREGRTDFGDSGYGGPCPPSGTHRYFFKAYAVDGRLNVPADASRADLEQALRGHVVAWGELMAKYAHLS